MTKQHDGTNIPKKRTNPQLLGTMETTTFAKKARIPVAAGADKVTTGSASWDAGAVENPVDSESVRKKQMPNIVILPDGAMPIAIEENDYLAVVEMETRLLYQHASCDPWLVDPVDSFSKPLLNLETTVDPVPAAACSKSSSSTTPYITDKGRVYRLAIPKQNRYGHAGDVSTLPVSLGQLECLKYLSFSYSNIELIPPSIGCLKNLEELRLCDTYRLENLPVEIGDLSSLKSLNLSGANIRLLPPSIGRLWNLERLNLHYTKSLSKLPQEIGDVVNLKTLDLSQSSISSLPPSIGQLKNLKRLDLNHTMKLQKLPDEIGNMSSLRELDLQHSGITSFPRSIRNLKHLMRINLDKTKISQEHDALLTTVQTCSSLGHLGDDLLLAAKEKTAKLKTGTNDEEELRQLNLEVRQMKVLLHALVCNRGRHLTGFGSASSERIPAASCLWPLLLHRVRLVFKYPGFYYGHDHIVIPKPDAIYQILDDGRESFIMLIMNGSKSSSNNNSNSNSTKQTF